MPITFIPFDGWNPSGSYFGEGWNTATSLVPVYGDNRPWPKFVGSALSVADGPMTGRHTHVWGSGMSSTQYAPDAVTGYCGSPTKLYSIDLSTGGTFVNHSRAAAYATNPAGWRFASVGNDVWAANWLDVLQRRTNNTGNFADGVVSTFTPKARFIQTVREHLVAANLSNAGRFQDEVVWSDADDPTNFDPAATGSTSTSIAGAKRLVSIPGQITALVGGQYLLAFKRKCIYYGEYAGPPPVFNFDVLSPSVGTAFPSSLINSRYGLFFLGPDGFYRMQGLSEPVKISTPGIDNFLLNNAQFANYPFDPANLLIGTFFPWEEDTQAFGFQVAGLPLIGWALRMFWPQYGNDVAILYNPVEDKWAFVNVADTGGSPYRVECLLELPYATSVNGALAALTWNGTGSRYSPLSALGTVFAPSLSLNFRPVNVDSQARQKRGNQFGQSMLHGVLPVFSKTSASGTALTESVTAEAILDPHGAPGTPEVRVSTDRNAISGYYPFTLSGRFFRISIQCAAEDFANFEGVFVHFEELGPE